MTIMTDYAIFYGTYDNPGERFFLMYAGGDTSDQTLEF